MTEKRTPADCARITPEATIHKVRHLSGNARRAVHLALFVFLGVGCPRFLFADSVPPSLQAAIVAKILAYDRALKARAGASVGIGVVFKESDKASAESGGAMLRAFEGLASHQVQDLPLTTSGHAYKSPEQLAQWLKSSNVHVLYVAVGLTKERDAIRAACTAAMVLTVGTDRTQVEAGLAVGVVLQGTAPRILVNITVAQASGADLDPKLLALADIVR
jgi:YfiR/HmsC-like